MRAPAGTERGSVTLLALAVMAVAFVVVLLLADMTVFVAARARAQLAADAAALAAAPLTFFESGDGGHPAAAAAASAGANGAELLRCECSRNATWGPRTVLVEVEIRLHGAILYLGSVRAKAAATFDPTRLLQ